MIAPQDQFLTSQGPMKSWFDRARQAEKEKAVLSISLFPMQPWVDVAEGGWAVVVYTDNDPALAGRIACLLADLAWSLREDFWLSERVPPAEAVQQAVDAPEGLIILSDMGDAVYGGGTGDSTCVLREMLKQSIPCPAYIPVVDPETVEQALKNGTGVMELSVGAKKDPFSEPVVLRGHISAISKGLQMDTERGLSDLGKTVVFEVQNLKIVLLENRSYAINQPILYTHLGLDMEQAKIVVVKTGSNFQYFQPWRKGLIRVDSPGTTQSDLKAFDWRKLPRPVFPLDEIPEWKSVATIVEAT
jgi:microcystin degradation protein MlrC